MLESFWTMTGYMTQKFKPVLVLQPTHFRIIMGIRCSHLIQKELSMVL